jgi:hypothetical protein
VERLGRLVTKSATPGLLLLVLSWCITYFRLDFRGLVEDHYGFLQFVSPDALASEPLVSILNLHVQPPLLNVLAAIDLALTPESHLFAALLFLALSVVSLVLVVDSLRILGVARGSQVFGGLLFAVLPATVIYSLFFYNTNLVVFGTSLAIWGSLRTKSRPIVGTLVTSFGALVLTMARPSFLWVFGVTWIFVHLIIAFRRCGWNLNSARRLAPAIAVVAVIFVAQGHYFFQFGLLTMSSFGGQNVAHGIKQSNALFSRGQVRIPDEVVARLQGRPCQISLIESMRDGTAPLWDTKAFRELPGCSEVPPLPDRGVQVWDSSTKVTSLELLPNPNSSDSLVAAREWQSAISQLLISDPRPLFRMAFATDSSRPSGLILYLGSAEIYDPVMTIRAAHPLSGPGRVLSLAFAPAALALGFTGWIVARRSRGKSSARPPTLLVVWILVGYHMGVSVLGEWGEGMRFQAEISPALLVLLISGGWNLFRGQMATDDGSVRGADEGAVTNVFD